MTAYSYTDWNGKSADEQKNQPGVGINSTHLVNNPNRGTYWSPETAASALGVHIETTLAGDDRVEARRMWNALRQIHRSATESPRMIDRAMGVRQSDAHQALGSYNADLDETQLAQLVSVTDDVVNVQREAQLVGVDPIMATRRMMQRAASRAVGYDLDDSRIEPELRPLVESRGGRIAIANMDQSVAQLHLTLKDRSIDESSFQDALDHMPQIGRDIDVTDEIREDHRRLNDILGSVPMVLNPVGVEPERNFSVRMDTEQEARVMETVIRWVGDQPRMPEPREVNRAFSSWRDNGMDGSPYTHLQDRALGVVVGSGAKAAANVKTLIEGLDSDERTRGMPVIVLAVEAGDDLGRALSTGGRNVVGVSADADRNGAFLDSKGADLPENRVELVNLTREQANDPIARSLAANAFVGRSAGIGYVAGSTKMEPVAAQAVHLAGTLRKLNLGIHLDNSGMHKGELADLRKQAREIDAQADPQRYFTAGLARPHRGINAVAFESARMYDMANKANAPGRDLIGEAYDRIGENTTILAVDNPKNASIRWMDENARDRRVLYAEATRTLSFAEIVGNSQDSEKRNAREAETEIKIYQRPAHERQYENRSYGPEGGEATVSRRVCVDPVVEWDDPMVRGAIILVSGNAGEKAMNVSSQATKVAQEAVMDRAHTALILTDHSARRASTDAHASHMIRLAGEMGKAATIIDGRGAEMGIADAREATRSSARNHMEKKEHELGEMQVVSVGDGRNAPVAVSVGDNLGQLALAAMPGMNAQKAAMLIDSNFTLEELRTDKSDEMGKALIKLGMPAETRAVIHDVKPWERAMNMAMDNLEEADRMGAKLHVPADLSHPIDRTVGQAISKDAVLSIGEYDYENLPLAAFVGNADRYRQPGQALTLSQAQKAGPGAEGGIMVDPADTLDRATLRRSIEEFSRNGYGIGVTLEQGVSRAVLEEARHVPDAKVVVMAPGNFQAAPPELRAAVRDLFEQDRAAVIMPVNVRPHRAPDAAPGEEQKPDTYTEDRTAMRNMLATAAKVGVVVASGSTDQSLHTVRELIAQEKPVAALVPQDIALAGSELYSGNMKLLRGAGRTSIQSLSFAQAPSAQAYAEISDDRDQTEVVNGVRMSTAGSFQSARLGRSDMLRAGHHHIDMGWGHAAHAISSADSVERFIDKAEQGLGALGRYHEPTERDLEAQRLGRERRSQTRDATRVSMFVAQEFGQTSALHRGAIDRDADYRIEQSGMDDRRFDRVSSERAAMQQAAAAGHSMG